MLDGMRVLVSCLTTQKLTICRMIESLLLHEKLQVFKLSQLSALPYGLSKLKTHPALKMVSIECETCAKLCLKDALLLPQLYSVHITNMSEYVRSLSSSASEK